MAGVTNIGGQQLPSSRGLFAPAGQTTIPTSRTLPSVWTPNGTASQNGVASGTGASGISGILQKLLSEQGINLAASGLGMFQNYAANEQARELTAEQQRQNLYSQMADQAAQQQQMDFTRSMAGLQATQLDPLVAQKAAAKAAVLRSLAAKGPAVASPQNANGQLSGTANLGPELERYLGDTQVAEGLANLEAARMGVNPDGTPTNLGNMGLKVDTAPFQGRVAAAQQAAKAQLTSRQNAQTSAMQNALANIQASGSANASAGAKGGGKKGFLGKLLGVASPFLAFIPGAGIPLAAGAAAASAALQGGSAGDALLAGAGAGAGGYMATRGRVR